MKIAVVGAGYVGLSLSCLLSKYNEVVLYDINKEKVDKINACISPIKDKEIQDYLKDEKNHLKATTNRQEAFEHSKYIVICTPTDYDEHTNYFNTSSIESVIESVIDRGGSSTIIIKSTIPIGFVDLMRKKYKTDKIIFSPEFLREGTALHDNLYPTRIIIGSDSKEAKIFVSLLQEAALKEDIPILFLKTREAESIKLFSNAYLALRVAFFNELDTYAEMNQLDSKSIIEGVSLDPRIGNYYHNPSFGYGGYCLTKDTKQLLAPKPYYGYCDIE